MIEKIVIGESYAAIGFAGEEGKTPVRVTIERIDIVEQRPVIIARVGGADPAPLASDKLLRVRTSLTGSEEPVTWDAHQKQTAHQQSYEMRRQFTAHMDIVARDVGLGDRKDKEGWVKLTLTDYEELRRTMVVNKAVNAACERLLSAVGALRAGDAAAARKSLAEVGVTL